MDAIVRERFAGRELDFCAQNFAKGGSLCKLHRLTRIRSLRERIFVRRWSLFVCVFVLSGVGAGAVRLFVCAVPFISSVRFSEFFSLRFARGGAPRSTWKKTMERFCPRTFMES